MSEPARKRNNMINENGLTGGATRTSSGKRSAFRTVAEAEAGDREPMAAAKAAGSTAEMPTRTGRLPQKAPGNRLNGSKDSNTASSAKRTEKNIDSNKPAGLSQAYVDKKRVQDNKSRQGWRRTIAEAYRDIERTAGHGRRDGHVSDRTAGHFARQMVKAPRYVKNTASAAVGAYRSIRYLSKVRMDVKTGALSAKEARIATLRRGGDSLKEAGRAALAKIGREASDFYGSDDLGVEAVRKPKDVLVNGYRTMKVASGVAKTVARAPAKARKGDSGKCAGRKKSGGIFGCSCADGG
jgi:hypothetical protein